MRLRPRVVVRTGGAPTSWSLARTATAVSTWGPATTARCSASRAGGGGLAALRRARARGPRPQPSARTARISRRAPLPTARSTPIDRAGASRGHTSIPPGQYHLAPAFDGQGRLLVATGAEGRILPRQPPRTKSASLFTSRKATITAAGRGQRRQHHAGQARRAASSTASTARARCSSSTTRPTAGQGGGRVRPRRRRLRRRLIDGRTAATPTGRACPSSTPSPRPAAAAEVIAPSFSLAGPPPPPSPSAAPARSRSAAGPRRARVVVSPRARSTPWSSSDECRTPWPPRTTACSVGTGSKGKVYRVRSDRSWTMVTSFPAEQVTNLVRARSTGESSWPLRIGPRPRPGSGGGHATGRSPQGQDTDLPCRAGDVCAGKRSCPRARRSRSRRAAAAHTGTPTAPGAAWSAPSTGPPGAPHRQRARALPPGAYESSMGPAGPLAPPRHPGGRATCSAPAAADPVHHRAPAGEVFKPDLAIGRRGRHPRASTSRAIRRDDRAACARIRTCAITPLAWLTSLHQKGDADILVARGRSQRQTRSCTTCTLPSRCRTQRRFRPAQERRCTDAVLAWDTTTRAPNGRRHQGDGQRRAQQPVPGRAQR